MFLLRKLDTVEELQKPFDPKTYFWSKLHFRNRFSSCGYIHTHTTFFPSDFLCPRRVSFLRNLTGHASAAREKTRLARALIFRLERTERNMITFRYSRKIVNLRKFKGFSFPLATKFPSSKIYFRIFDHFCEHLSSRASSLNEGNSEWDPISSSEGNTPAPSKHQTPVRRKKSSG